MIGRVTDENGTVVKDINDLCQIYLTAILNAIGPEGTVFAPGYSYTIGKHRADSPSIFDPMTTRAEIGPFPNCLLKTPGMRRNHDPMVSVIGLGPGAEKILANCSSTSYGDDCAFARLLEIEKMKVCNIGLGPNWTPFIHYADYLAKVPFRYEKLFSGLVKRNGTIEEIEWIYQVPALIDQSFADAHISGGAAYKKGIFKAAALGRARVFTASYKEYFEFVLEQLSTEKWWQAKGPKCDVFKEDLKRLPFAMNAEQFSSAVVSASQNKRIDTICSVSEEVTYRKWKTGDWISDWIVPERFELMQVEITDENGKPILGTKVAPYSISYEGRLMGREIKEKAKKYSLTKEHFWLRRDWALLDVELLDDEAVFGVKINSATGLGHLSAVANMQKNRSSASIILDSTSFPSLTNEEFSELFWYLSHEIPTTCISAGPGEIGLAAAISAFDLPKDRLLIHLKSNIQADRLTQSYRRKLRHGGNPLLMGQIETPSVIDFNYDENLDQLRALCEQ